MTRTYRLPEPLVRAFEAWRERTGISAQEAVSAGLYHVLAIDGTARDELLGRMKDAVREMRAADPESAVEIARARAAAAKDFTEAEAARKGRTGRRSG